ncbi:hypothetical protein [Demequina sediminicola]|uniref:hypothetical protein n=1 Tax=Demequina sediminicola TaxID=1095026 RepID=UPI000785BD70|nr:hypothetical protein [Demequina sediminicola]
MVATLLRLKYTVVAHQLQREWWRALLLIGGAVWSLTLIPLVWWAQTWLGFQPADVRTTIVVILATVCVVGWWVVPLMVTGLEDTLDPGKFATWGVKARTLLPGLTASAFLTVPALFFMIVFLVLSRGWRYDEPAAQVVAVIGAVLTVAVMVVGARVCVAWSTRAVNNRRSRTLLFLSIGLAVVMVGVAGWAFLRDGLEAGLETTVPVAGEWLARTPIGAGVAAPGAWVAGDITGAVWRLVLMAATLVLLMWAWKRAIAYTLTHPVYRGGGRRRRTDAVLTRASDAEPAWWRADAPTRAVRARLLISWATDARYIVNAVGVAALPVVFFVLVMPILELDPRWGFAAPVLLASSIGWGRHNDVALDSTALWMDIVSGKHGRAVMHGRLQAVAVWAVPAVLLAAIGVLAWTGRWADAPGLVGATLGTLGVTLGISALSSVALPYRAAAPGESPFGAEVGSLGASVAAQLVSSIATLMVLPLVTVPFILSLTVHAGWGWMALVTGVAMGVAGLWGGASAAGSLYNRRTGALIGAVS